MGPSVVLRKVRRKKTLRGAVVVCNYIGMSPIGRDQVFQVRFSDTERAMLNAVADGMGLSGADAVRQLIQQKFTELFASEIQKSYPKSTAVRPDQLGTVAARLGYELGRALANTKKK